MKEYYFENKEFVIENYINKKPFSSFLPGIAGKMGIPLWAFYVNRGQGISSFGTRDKGNPILEFSPANTAYQTVDRIGFRTFVKVDNKVYEFFKDVKNNSKMYISKHGLSIEETNFDINIKVVVKYFGLPNENLAALVRKVDIYNLDNYNRQIEIIDGLSQIFPYGVANGNYKEMSNLLRSWMDVENLKDDFAFYKMRSSTSDESEMKAVVSGNFYVSFVDNKLKRPIVDNNLIFGYDTSLSQAIVFEEESVVDIREKYQVTANKVPAGYTLAHQTLGVDDKISIITYIGSAYNVELVYEFINKASNRKYYNSKLEEAKLEVDILVDNAYLKSNFPILDEYLKQSFLDNILRGGYPVIMGKDKKFVYHLFSRKHGDLERDYNYFSLAPEFFSQGNGNFRDVCQNRRNDSLLVDGVDDYNVKFFGSLIQYDGYNPLSINGSSFVIENKKDIEKLMLENFENNDQVIIDILNNKFSPGMIINTIENNKIKTKYNSIEVLNNILDKSKQDIEAVFGEGYWIDHWTYILDLIENYLKIYPDKFNNLMFDDMEYKTYQSIATVLPRSEKTVITPSGEIRQYGSVIHKDQQKIDKCNLDVHSSNWHKLNNGQIYYTNLFNKILILIANKFSSLDPFGIGISMESDKPGWNDAMNGLPGLFGSGVSETIELKRLIDFIKDRGVIKSLEIQKQVYSFLYKINELTVGNLSDFDFWNEANNVKENYRNKCNHNFKNEFIETNYDNINSMLNNFSKKLNHSIEKAIEYGKGIIPTFITYKVNDYIPLTEDGHPKIGIYGLPLAIPKGFEIEPLTPFLEAPARYLKIENDVNKSKKLYKLIKKTDIYDSENKMYKTSGNLDKYSLEIGRIRAFTKGWLEREANFLHMTYKYLLGLLKSGLYEEFYDELFDNFVCFMEPQKYGRSTTENSSFIAPDVNPNKEIRGQGFMARLTGSTAEVLSIIFEMMMGKTPFKFSNNVLTFEPKPIIHKDLFDENNSVEYKFLGKTIIQYINESGLSTYDPTVSIYKIQLMGERVVDIDNNLVMGQYADEIRLGKYKKIIIFIR